MKHTQLIFLVSILSLLFLNFPSIALSVRPAANGQATLVISYSVIGGGTPYPPTINYVSNGTSRSLTLKEDPQNIMADVGSHWSIQPNPLGSPNSNPNEQWDSDQRLEGEVIPGTTTFPPFLFYHQFFLTFSYHLTPGGSSPGPRLTVMQFGMKRNVTLTTTPQPIFLDSNSSWIADQKLPNFSYSERWWNANWQNNVTTSASYDLEYTHQYLLTLGTTSGGTVEASPCNLGNESSQCWEDADNSVTVFAKALPDYVLAGWKCVLEAKAACPSENDNPARILMSGPTNITAVFQRVIHITISTQNNTQSIIVDGKLYNITSMPTTLSWLPNSLHNLTALQGNECGFNIGFISGCVYVFKGWIVDNSSIKQTLTLKLTGDEPHTITGVWEKSYFNLETALLVLTIIIAGVAMWRWKRLRKPVPTQAPFTRPSGLLYRVGFLSDVGKVRSNNEDSILTMEIGSIFESKPTSTILLAVADGVGGSQKGEVASKIALQTIASTTAEQLAAPTRPDFGKVLRTSVESANEAIVKYGMAHRESEGMASTIVTSIINGNNAFLAHAGDSRAYLVNRGEIRQLTKDHSQVQESVDAGKITAEEARHYEGRNIITRALGASTDIQIDTSTVSLSEGDRLLLCTDGLWEPVIDKEMQRVIMEATDPQAACGKLVKLANERGGKDNVSLVIVEIRKEISVKQA